MSIQVMYFASLREAMGREKDMIEVDSPIPASQAWVAATGQQEMPDKVLIAINHEYADADALVHSGDELAFFPPVTGG